MPTGVVVVMFCHPVLTQPEISFKAVISAITWIDSVFDSCTGEIPIVQAVLGDARFRNVTFTNISTGGAFYFHW